LSREKVEKSRKIEVLMEWAEKIRYIEKELGIVGKKGALANILGVRHGRISEIKNGKSKNPGADLVLLLIDKLGVNPDWLNNETQPVFLIPKRLEKQPFASQKFHEKVGKTTSLSLLDSSGDSTIEPIQQKPPGIPLVYEGELSDGTIIPLLENAASAGYGAELGEEDVPVRYVQVPRFLAKYPHLASLPVKGDSMEPTLHDGDLVVCDGGGWDGDGLYVLKTHDMSYVKRVQISSNGYKVISDNKMYESLIESTEDLSIVGKVRAILVVTAGRRGV
jgi:phage repressor protein C with HTH and peptisase S24 domain